MQPTLPDNEKALWILKKRGPQTVSALADVMGITTEGARFHLLKLEKEGLVASTSVAQGRGRPKQVWSITVAGNSRFPDTHADLTVNLLAAMRETLGNSAVEKVIKEHENRLLTRYKREIDNGGELETRIAKLVEIRTAEGYMAEYHQDEEGYILIENHCPICVAATACEGFCKSEMNIFQAVLGKDTTIERTQHIVAGDRRCAYRIKPAPPK
jgi:predicted ArsR family transcriptional regulator